MVSLEVGHKLMSRHGLLDMKCFIYRTTFVEDHQPNISQKFLRDHTIVLSLFMYLVDKEKSQDPCFKTNRKREERLQQDRKTQQVVFTELLIEQQDRVGTE